MSGSYFQRTVPPRNIIPHPIELAHFQERIKSIIKFQITLVTVKILQHLLSDNFDASVINTSCLGSLMFQGWTRATDKCWSRSTVDVTRLVSWTVQMEGEQ